MNITDIITTDEARKGFYPTPMSVAERMLESVDWAMVETILEPSAGKGDLIRATAKARYKHDRWNRHDLDVDAVEFDPYLREICKYNFSEKRVDELRAPYEALRYLPYEERERRREELDESDVAWEAIDRINIHMVHDDFLTYRTYKHYDLILMNPPFADGDLHLIKALEMQKDGGQVICLLNAETILNPYTNTRIILKKKLQELNAEIEFLENAFSTDAERKARVDVALIRVNIPIAHHESTLFDRMKKAAEEEYIPDAEIQALMPTNFIDQAVCQYNAEVAATMELIREYKALKPYIINSFSDEPLGKDPIIALVVEGDSTRHGVDVQKYMRCVRLKYWKALFKNDEFTGRLTSNLKKQFNETVNKMADYEFSIFNIKQVMVEMNAAMQQGVRDTIMALFEKLTAEHSWYPECANNRHYYNGWKTNKAHKIGKKSIIPANGLYSSYSWDKDRGFDVYKAYNVLSDIEKAFDFLDGGRFTGYRYDLSAFLRAASERKQSRNIECTYFMVDLFKKGTVHIKFRPEAMPLVDRLNIYAAKGKNWLPPNYGKVTYATMDAEEKAVVDGLNGDGSEGSGERAYFEVCANAAYYLSSPVREIPALMSAE